MFVEKLTITQANKIIINVLGSGFYVYPKWYSNRTLIEMSANKSIKYRVIKKLIDDKKTIYTCWAKLEGEKLTVNAFDHACYWEIRVELTDTSIKILEYTREGTGNTKFFQDKYKKELFKIFGNEYAKKFNKLKPEIEKEENLM